MGAAYQYDAAGNWLSSLGLSPYTFNSSNQLLTTPATTYTYDANGNTLSKAAANGTSTYTWNSENRLTQVTNADNSVVNFTYDPFGRRIQKASGTVVTNYVYDGANIVGEYDATGALQASYTQGAGVDQPLAMKRGGAISYYQADGLGSITSLDDANGNPLATYTYDSFGRNVGGTVGVANPYQYTARELDQETGLYYYRARYYDPTIGRFISEDPLEFGGYDVNFYRYVFDDPTVLVDPSGRGATGAGIGAGIGGVIGGVIGGTGGGIVGGAGGTLVGPEGTVIGAGVGGAEGAAVGTATGAATGAAIGSAVEDFIAYFSKGGKQNIANEIVDQARAMFGNDKDAICKWLDQLYSNASPSQRLKIKVAQKFFGCRRSCGGGN